MSDAGFREIHLSGKHVVFAFMAVSVVGVGVFLLGVSVGKGVTRTETPAQAAAAPNGADAGPGALPESTQPNKGELDYYKTLQEKGTPTPTPVASPAATPAATPSPTQTPSASPSAAKPPAATGKPYFVLVDSFSSLKNANTRLAEVKKKGYEAAIFTAPSGTAPYKVRLGPFPDKPAADAMGARLRKEGYRPSVIR